MLDHNLRTCSNETHTEPWADTGEWVGSKGDAVDIVARLTWLHFNKGDKLDEGDMGAKGGICEKGSKGDNKK